MASLTIRRATADDLHAAGDLASALGFFAFGREALVDGARQPGRISWVAERESTVVGLANVQLAADEAELHLVLVAPDLRRQGLGRRLLEAVEREVHEQGAQTLFLEVARSNHPARELYQAAGFEQAGVRARYYADGEDALILRKRLG